MPTQVAAKATWKATDIVCGMRGCSAPADYINMYVRKENGVALPIFGRVVLVYRLLNRCTVHPGELSK